MFQDDQTKRKVVLKIFCVFNLYILLTISMLACRNDTLKKIEGLIQSEMHQEAKHQLEDYVKSEPNNAQARMLLGKTYNALGQHHDAVDQFKKASLLYSSLPKERIAVRFELARTYLIFGDRKSAYAVLNLIQKGSSDEKTLRKVIQLVGDSFATKQLTFGNSDNYSPVFSLDNTQIAFSSFRTDNSEIYLMNLDGQIKHRVTYTTDYNDTSPTFLSDPNYIIYSSEPKSSREAKVVIQSSGSTPIYTGFNITHIHSKVTQPILPISFGARVPRSSPSGNHIVYETNTDGNLEIYLMDLSAADLSQLNPADIPKKRLTNNDIDDGSPTFFPSGKRIVFVSSRNEVHQLYTIDIDGKNEKHINPSRYDTYNPTVSPDGKTIAFVSARDGDWEIYLVDSNGKNERQITSGIGRSIQPAFSPDGRYLAYVSDRSDTFHIYLMDLEKPVTREELVKLLQQ